MSDAPLSPTPPSSPSSRAPAEDRGARERLEVRVREAKKRQRLNPGCVPTSNYVNALLDDMLAALLSPSQDAAGGAGFWREKLAALHDEWWEHRNSEGDAPLTIDAATAAALGVVLPRRGARRRGAGAGRWHMPDVPLRVLRVPVPSPCLRPQHAGGRETMSDVNAARRVPSGLTARGRCALGRDTDARGSRAPADRHDASPVPSETGARREEGLPLGTSSALPSSACVAPSSPRPLPPLSPRRRPPTTPAPRSPCDRHVPPRPRRRRAPRRRRHLPRPHAPGAPPPAARARLPRRHRPRLRGHLT
jgi:hypothetical protein